MDYIPHKAPCLLPAKWFPWAELFPRPGLLFVGHKSFLFLYAARQDAEGALRSQLLICIRSIPHAAIYNCEEDPISLNTSFRAILVLYTVTCAHARRAHRGA